MIKSVGLCLTQYGISVSSSLEFENMRSCAHFQFIVNKSSLMIKGRRRNGKTERGVGRIMQCDPTQASLVFLRSAATTAPLATTRMKVMNHNHMQCCGFWSKFFTLQVTGYVFCCFTFTACPVQNFTKIQSNSAVLHYASCILNHIINKSHKQANKRACIPRTWHCFSINGPGKGKGGKIMISSWTSTAYIF